jgi:hypothetical protein
LFSVTPFEIKLKLIKSFSEIYRLYPIKKLVYDYKNFLENKIITSKLILEEALYDSNININSLEDDFLPSKTSINSLNFITKNEEEKIKNLKSNNENINTIIKIIYILINENYDEIKNENLINNLYEILFNKYKIDSISKLK